MPPAHQSDLTHHSNRGPKSMWLVSKQPLIAEAIKHSPSNHPSPLVITAQFESVSSTLMNVTTTLTAPDVIMVDCCLHQVDDVADLVQAAAKVDVPTVVYTSERRPYPVQRIITAGVAGFVLKSDAMDELLATITRARVGHLLTGSAESAKVAAGPDSFASLAPRVVETVKLLAMGRTRAQVAHDLVPAVKPSTVSTYIQRAFGEYKRLGREVESTCALIHEARRDGYLDDGRCS